MVATNERMVDLLGTSAYLSYSALSVLPLRYTPYPAQPNCISVSNSTEIGFPSITHLDPIDLRQDQILVLQGLRNEESGLGSGDLSSRSRSRVGSRHRV